MFGNYCRSKQIHSLSMSTITWREHNELKYSEIRPCASHLAAKPTMAKWRVGHSWRGLQGGAGSRCLLTWTSCQVNLTDMKRGIRRCFSIQTWPYRFKQTKKKGMLQLYFLCSHWICMLEPSAMFIFTVQPSTEPVCNTNMQWNSAAHSCVCYHRLSWVITGYHSALGPRNSFNPPLALPAHWAQGGLVCNQSVGRTPL